MAKLSKEEVEKIAELAKIELTKNEVKKYQEQLSVILDYVEMLGEVDTSDVEPTAQVTGLENVMRSDDLNVCSPEVVNALVEAFPEKKDKLLKVQKVF